MDFVLHRLAGSRGCLVAHVLFSLGLVARPRDALRARTLCRGFRKGCLFCARDYVVGRGQGKELKQGGRRGGQYGMIGKRELSRKLNVRNIIVHVYKYSRLQL